MMIMMTSASVTRLAEDSSTTTRVPTIDAAFYIHFYHHGATDITRFDNERMTLNFLIARQNLKFLMKIIYKRCGCSTSLYISQP